MLKKFLNRKKEVSNLPEPDFRQPENAENSIENTEPTPLSEQINDVNVEAGLPLNSSGGKNNMTKVAVVGVGLLGVGMTVAGLIAFSGSSNEDEAVAAKQQELERVKNTQSKDFLLKNWILDKKKLLRHLHLLRHRQHLPPNREPYRRLIR